MRGFWLNFGEVEERSIARIFDTENQTFRRGTPTHVLTFYSSCSWPAKNLTSDDPTTVGVVVFSDYFSCFLARPPSIAMWLFSTIFLLTLFETFLPLVQGRSCRFKKVWVEARRVVRLRLSIRGFLWSRVSRARKIEKCREQICM